MHYFHHEPIHVCVPLPPLTLHLLCPPFNPRRPFRSLVLRDQIRGHARDRQGEGRRTKERTRRDERHREETRTKDTSRRRVGYRVVRRIGRPVEGKGGGRRRDAEGCSTRRAALALSKDQQALTRRGRTCVRFVGRGGGGARGGKEAAEEEEERAGAGRK